MRYNRCLGDNLKKYAKISKKYMSTKMRSSTYVRYHVMTMTNYLNEVELNGSILDEPTQVSIILNSLLKDFNHFASIFVMHKLNYRMSQLLNKLQTYESICGTINIRREAHVAKGSSSESNTRTKS